MGSLRKRIVKKTSTNKGKNRKIAPCKKCPYRLGLVRMIVNPCPECKLHNYSTYDWLIMKTAGKN